MRKGRLWVGLFPLDQIDDPEKRRLFQLPLPCTVLYNPDNPRLNVLTDIDIKNAKLAVN